MFLRQTLSVLLYKSVNDVICLNNSKRSSVFVFLFELLLVLELALDPLLLLDLNEIDKLLLPEWLDNGVIPCLRGRVFVFDIEILFPAFGRGDEDCIDRPVTIVFFGFNVFVFFIFFMTGLEVVSGDKEPDADAWRTTVEYNFLFIVAVYFRDDDIPYLI